MRRNGRAARASGDRARARRDEHFTLGANAGNLLLQKTVLRQGDFDFSRIDKGVSFGVRLGFTY